MSRRSLLSPLLLALAALCFSGVALAQDTAHGRWVTDANNRATGVFLFEPPPPEFKPLMASDVELEQHGFPPRPSEPERYARWKRMATARFITPELKPIAVHHALPKNRKIVSSAGNAITSTSDNWSGYIFAVPDLTFALNNSMIYAEWTVPAVMQAPGVCTSTAVMAAQWVGFDGLTAGEDLLQAGTEGDATCVKPRRHPITTATYYAWFEWLPGSAYQLTNFPVGPGNAVQVSVWFTTAEPFGHAVFINLSTDQGTLIGFNPPSGTNYFGNSAEWILERPCLTVVDGTCTDFANLANYGFFAFDSAFAFNTQVSYLPGTTPAGATSEQITMVCPPWNPSTSCVGRHHSNINISTFNLTTGKEGNNAMTFTAEPPAGP